MGLIVRLSGVHAVEWTQERADADPVVELDAGYNLVAWMGDDHTALNQALSGIGPPLRGARVWSADGDMTVHEVGQDLQRESPSLPVAHGTALWVNVDRATFWLQSVLLPDTYPLVHAPWHRHRSKQARERDDPVRGWLFPSAHCTTLGRRLRSRQYQDGRFRIRPSTHEPPKCPVQSQVFRRNRSWHALPSWPCRQLRGYLRGPLRLRADQRLAQYRRPVQAIDLRVGRDLIQR